MSIVRVHGQSDRSPSSNTGVGSSRLPPRGRGIEVGSASLGILVQT
jgi:hypothetical protein